MTAVLASAFLPHTATAQQPVQTVFGTVRDPSGSPLPGADVLLGRRSATTSAQGVFRVDSLRPGRYAITIRLVGYTPIRGAVDVETAAPTELVYVMEPAPYILPEVVTDAHRTGIYGTVADNGLHAAIGARVLVLGSRGGDVRTDSLGRFSFPKAENGTYLVRITYPGYRERRLTVQLKRGEGRELAVRLTPGFESTVPGMEGAFQDLRLRLAMGLRRERMAGPEIARFGSTQLCHVPMNAGGSPVIIVNGVDVYKNMPREFLCFWQADEVEVLEFGPDICREATHSIEFVVHMCTRGGVRRGPGGGGGGGGAAGYVVIWEKR